MPPPPISFPLTTLEELADRSYFASPHYPYNRCSVPLPQKIRADRPHLLVCHDMMGGYLDDKWVQGSNNNAAYSFWHWHLIDTFVYFSHHLVTLPPPGWTNAAHRHGVQVLGTFITEWEGGYNVCKKLLASKESIQTYASRLSELALAVGFDGWLINIENKVDKEQIQNLVDFVKLLTKYMHEQLPGSTVIWYDSVTKDGRLDWQNCLNDHNQCFFDTCDGIFTNYTWKENYPAISAKRAGSRKYDVYMGIDVFGRNTFGGGGFQTNIALKAARKAGVSAAIFAPGWVYETNQGPTFSVAQNRWWGLVSECWPSARKLPVHIPFFSNFDQGFGKSFHLSGTKISEKPWGNMSCQNPQPLLSIFSLPKNASFETSISGEYPVYSGGACVYFSGRMEQQTCCSTLLYDVDVTVSVPFTVSFTVRCLGDSQLSLLLKIDDCQHTARVLLVGFNEETHLHGVPSLTIVYPNAVHQVEGSEKWTFREYTVEVTGRLTSILAVSYVGKLNPGNIFDEISCSMNVPVSVLCSYDSFLGHIAISSGHKHNLNVLNFSCSEVHWEGDTGKKMVSLKLIWAVEDLPYDEILNYQIYVKKDANTDHFEHIGVAMVDCFYVSQLPVLEGSEMLTFYLQVTCVCGISTELAHAPHVSIPIQ